MDFLSKMIMEKQMAMTLSKLNEHFTKKEVISKDDFMELQLKCFNEVKKDLEKKGLKIQE